MHWFNKQDRKKQFLGIRLLDFFFYVQEIKLKTTYFFSSSLPPPPPTFIFFFLTFQPFMWSLQNYFKFSKQTAWMDTSGILWFHELEKKFKSILIFLIYYS